MDLGASRSVAELWIQEGDITEYQASTYNDVNGERVSVNAIRLNRESNRVRESLAMHYVQHPSAWANLQSRKRNILVKTVVDLLDGSLGLTWNHVRATLIHHDPETNWDCAFATAVDAGVIRLDVKEVLHARTGKPYMIKTLSINRDDPEVTSSLSESNQEHSLTPNVLTDFARKPGDDLFGVIGTTTADGLVENKDDANHRTV